MRILLKESFYSVFLHNQTKIDQRIRLLSDFEFIQKFNISALSLLAWSHSALADSTKSACRQIPHKIIHYGKEGPLEEKILNFCHTLHWLCLRGASLQFDSMQSDPVTYKATPRAFYGSTLRGRTARNSLNMFPWRKKCTLH
jgi:hypothetical protein